MMEKIKDSREAILSRVSKNKPSSRLLPDIPVFPVAGDILKNFLGHLEGFDGSYKLFATRDDAVAWLHKEAVTPGKNVYSAADGVTGNLSINDFASPASMNIIDTCIAEALMGVGETGSLLVDEKSLGSPAAALFSTDLYLLIDRKKIVESIQQAYERINLSDYQYSSFFSGPSATADIEAVHITGAQGEISLTAVLYNCTPDEIKQDIEVAAATPCAPVIKLRREADVAAGQDSI